MAQAVAPDVVGDLDRSTRYCCSGSIAQVSRSTFRVAFQRAPHWATMSKRTETQVSTEPIGSRRETPDLGRDLIEHITLYVAADAATP